MVLIDSVGLYPRKKLGSDSSSATSQKVGSAVWCDVIMVLIDNVGLYPRKKLYIHILLEARWNVKFLRERSNDGTHEKMEYEVRHF